MGLPFVAELAGNTYLPEDPDEFVSWAFTQRGGLQLMADRIRRAEDQVAILKKGIRLDGDFEVAFLNAYLDHFVTLREKAEKVDKLTAENKRLKELLDMANYAVWQDRM